MSSPPPTVQATALSRIPGSPQQWAQLAIGNDHVPGPGMPPNNTYYWYVVVSLKDLSIAVNTLGQETGLPQSVAAYANNPDYFLFVIGNLLGSSNVPQGDVQAFLQATGAGAGLAALEQIVGQLGTNNVTGFSYILAATMAQQDVPGFESWSITDTSVLTMQFLPVQVNGQWTYSPVQATAPVQAAA
jgi:hypothetical protein